MPKDRQVYILVCSTAPMIGLLLAFRLPPRKKNVEISKFCQRFYGQDTSSGGGRYRYRRHGLLDDIPYRKLLRGVIVIQQSHLETVLEFLENYDAEVHIREVKLTEEDKRVLEG